MPRINGVVLVAGGGVAVAGFVLALAVRSLSPDGQQSLILESAKAAIQVFPLAFFGVVVADLLRRRDEQRTQARMDRDYQRDLAQKRDEYVGEFLHNVVRAYNRTKAARRSLRGAGFGQSLDSPLTEEQLRQLDEHMSELSDAQLELERLKREIKARGDVFTRADAVRTALTDLERYVNDVIRDWETGRAKTGVGASFVSFNSWEKFRAFLANAKEDGDFGRAATQMQAIEDAIWPDVLEVRVV